MSDKYKIREKDRGYFITMTTVGWIDVFTRKEQKMIIVNALRYCQKEKGTDNIGLVSNAKSFTHDLQGRWCL